MAEQYTPTTEEVREYIEAADRVTAHMFSPDAPDAAAAFDRWLAAHDAQVRAEALAEVTDELVEVAAEAIWNLNPMPSWRTWSERVHLEKVEHRGDKSWSGPVDRCRNHARAALEAVRTATTNQQDRSE